MTVPAFSETVGAAMLRSHGVAANCMACGANRILDLPALVAAGHGRTRVGDLVFVCDCGSHRHTFIVNDGLHEPALIRSRKPPGSAAA